MTDDAARYAHVQSILGDALDRPADARAAFLDTACGDDDALRAEVEELLSLSAADDDDAGNTATVRATAPEITRRAIGAAEVPP